MTIRHVAIFMLFSVCLQAAALDLPGQSRIDRQAAESAREASTAKVQPDSLACTAPTPFPVSPLNGFAAGFFPASGYTGEQFNVTLWRESCGPGLVTSILYLRVVPTAGMPFICSSYFVVLQNGTQYDVRLMQSNAGSTFCNDLLAPVTLAVDQWPSDPKFDQSAPFILVFKGFYGNSQGTVLGNNGAKAKTLVLLELSDFEEGNMRGAINAYNANPALPFLRLVLEERTFARYSNLAMQLGMPAPPPR